MPFHRIEVSRARPKNQCKADGTRQRWENGWFRRCTLKSLGVRIQLGHRVGEVCPNPSTAAGDDFVVITTQGIEEVGLDYCDCGTTKAKSVQLLRMRLYPATGTNPRSAATFASLRRFAHMTLESKCSPYEFYHSLVRETDNTGLEPSRVSVLLSGLIIMTDRGVGSVQRVLEDDAAVAASAVVETRWPRPRRVRGSHQRNEAGRGRTLVPCLPSSRDQLAAGLANGASAPPVSLSEPHGMHAYRVF
jgi:hypothetical protein